MEIHHLIAYAIIALGVVGAVAALAARHVKRRRRPGSHERIDIL